MGIVVTEDMLEMLKTMRGGYTAKQLKAIGGKYPLESGWKKRLLGQEISLKKYHAAFYESIKSFGSLKINRKNLKSIKDRDNAMSDTWEQRSRRLRDLGLTYKEFLASDYWKGIRKRAKEIKHLQKCEFCGKKNDIHLHHKSYKYIMTPHEIHSLVALCSGHHKIVHDFARLQNTSVRRATAALKEAIYYSTIQKKTK